MIVYLSADLHSLATIEITTNAIKCAPRLCMFAVRNDVTVKHVDERKVFDASNIRSWPQDITVCKHVKASQCLFKVSVYSQVLAHHSVFHHYFNKNLIIVFVVTVNVGYGLLREVPGAVQPEKETLL